VVLEIASAAIICTSFAGEADLAGCLIVTLLHLGIETGQFFKQRIFQCLFSHPTMVDGLVNSLIHSMCHSRLPTPEATLSLCDSIDSNGGQADHWK
jgi:hypothetical protein